MYEHLKEWIESLLSAEYSYSLGPWTEDESTQFVCAIYANGGGAVELDIRRPRFKVMLIGPRNGQQHASKVCNDLNLIINAAIELKPPCGAANIRAITDLTGPAFTTENRAWATVDFQLIY